ncbi:hypothetical protein LguiA_036699 [Lonicera macranthoides]
MEKKEVKKVCVTGAARYLGSYLVKKLMERGMHSAVPVLVQPKEKEGDESKVGILNGLRNAKRRLELFEADLYNGDEIGKAIERLKLQSYERCTDDGKGAGRFELQVVATFRASIE